MVEKIVAHFNKLSYLSRLLIAASLIMWLKVYLSKLHNDHYVQALIEAALGQL